MKFFENIPLKIAVTYILVSLLWTITTDFILYKFHLFGDFWLNTLKGSLFLISTGLLIYVLVNKHLKGIREREEELTILIDALPDFVNFKDAKGRWIKSNQFGLKLFGLENVPFKGKKDSELAECSYLFRKAILDCKKSDEEAWKKGEQIQCEQILPQINGEQKIFDTIKVPLYHDDGGRKGLVVIGRDITKRKKTEELLEENEQLYRSLFENNDDGIFTIDLTGKVISVNDASEKILGYNKLELCGKQVWEFVEKSYVKKVITYFESMQQNPSSVTEIKVIHQDGNSMILRVKDVPIRVKGEITGYFIIFKNITEAKKNEEFVRKSEKLSVVGELASSVAHEIRNPLTSIKGFLQLLQQDENQHQYYIDIMLSEIDRINLIVSEFMILAKPHVTIYKEKDILSLLKNVTTLLKTLAIMKNIELIINDSIAPIFIKCEENQIKQVFINILKNAIEAVKDGGKIKVKVRKAENRVIIRIIDNGSGILKERIPKLGEPFYTTKEKGTGLGLMVSFKIIQEHSGSIKIKSKEHFGTVVEVSFPTVLIEGESHS